MEEQEGDVTVEPGCGSLRGGLDECEDVGEEGGPLLHICAEEE